MKEIRVITHVSQIKPIVFFPSRKEKVTAEEALKRARNLGLDLIFRNDAPDFSVCEILDAKKEEYNLSKQKKVKQPELKMLKINSLNISDNDLSRFIRQAGEFLSDGHSVRFKIQLNGTSKVQTSFGNDAVSSIEGKIVEGLKETPHVVASRSKEGKDYLITVNPKKKTNVVSANPKHRVDQQEKS